jgi:hypothetical protein
VGLGGAAEGATTVFAIALLIAATLFGLLLAGAVRWASGRWLPAMVVLLVWAALVSVVPIRDHFSADSQERRREKALTADVIKASGLSRPDKGVGFQDPPCEGSPTYDSNGRQREGWEAVATASGPDALVRLRAGLDRQGFRTTAGVVPERDGDAWVLATRGRASVLAVQASYQRPLNQISLRVEDGCSGLAPPRPRFTPHD